VLCFIASITVEAKKKKVGNNVYWELDDYGTLTISGSGNMPNLHQFDYPWYRKIENGKIKRIVVEEGITSIGNYSFECDPKSTNDYWTLKEVILPSSLEIIGEYAFCYNKGLKKVTFGKNLKTIGNSAFWGCNSLVDIILPKNLEIIGEEAFEKYDSPTKKISIPLGVKSIGYHAFSYIDYVGGNKVSLDYDCELLLLPIFISSDYTNCDKIGIPRKSVGRYLSTKIRNINGEVILTENSLRKIIRCIDREDSSTYYRVVENGIEGIADQNGTWTVPLEMGLTSLDSIKLKSVSYYIAKNSKTSKFCIISAKGKNILGKDYDLIERAGRGYLRIKDGNYYGIVTTRGKELIPTTRSYTFINDYDGSYFAFTKKGYTGKCNKNGQELSLTKLPPTVDDIKVTGSYASAVELKDGSTKYWKVSKGGRYGLADAEGKVIVPTEMEALESAGTGYLRYKLNGFWGVMNYAGKIIIDTDRGYTSIGDFKTFNKRFPYTMTGFKGECDATGRQISKIKVDTPPQQQVVVKKEDSPQKEDKKVEEIIIKRDPIPVQQWQACWACGGMGTMGCDNCGGGGTKYIGDRLHRCSRCNGQGIIPCRVCYGNKGQYITVYQ
jgi:hypothetical protein